MGYEREQTIGATPFSSFSTIPLYFIHFSIISSLPQIFVLSATPPKIFENYFEI